MRVAGRTRGWRGGRLSRYLAGATLAWASSGTAFVAPVAHETLRVERPRAALLADVDGDGDGDGVVIDRRGRVGVVVDDGSFGDLRPLDLPSLPGRAARLAAGDLDRDGDVDLVVCSNGPRRKLGDRACRLLLGRPDGGGFADATDAANLGPTEPRVVPLLADFDGDGDLDLLLFPERRRARARILRNALDGPALSFVAVEATDALPASGVRSVAIVDAAGRGTKLWAVLRGRPAALLELDEASGRWVDRARERGLPKRPTRGGLAAAGDLDGDGLPDVVVAGTGRRPILFRQRADGTFATATIEASGSAATALAVADFDRDDRRDLYLARARGGSVLLANQGSPEPDGVPAFADVAADAGVDASVRARDAAVFLRTAACDSAVDLLVASAARTPSVVHRFPDDSAGRTTPASGPLTQVTRENGCAAGTDGPERLVGHRVASVLRGAGGDDTLIARAGVTVLDGGAGRDRFEAAGFTIVHLPPGDVEPGETLDCRGADQVWLATPLTRAQLDSMGFVFEHCFEEDDCDEPSDFDGNACHGIHSNLGFVAPGAPPYQLLKQGLDFGFAAPVGGGFGECESSADCYAIGLDACRTATGAIPIPPQKGKCYPSGFDGLEGPIADWCRDPFWARLRYDEVRQQLASEGRKLVLPVVVWIIRSDALGENGLCTIAGHAQPPSIAAWHDSVASAVNSSMSLYAKWGLVYDYQFKVVTVPSDSDFVADAEDDRCRVKLVHTADAGDADENRTIGKLLEQYPSYYRTGHVNVYLTDVAPAGSGAGSGVAWSSPVPFIILRETAGALAHEIGHRIGLGHPYSNNVVAAGVEPGEAESRDSWTHRPFPDPTQNRLQVCGSDAVCGGVDAPAGDCRKAPGAIFGYCRNLKLDCAEDGDHVCDTPWDAIPCFQGVSSNEGGACTTNADCQKASSARGTSRRTRCAQGVCVKAGCTTNADCDGGSWCAGGHCINHKEGVDACCELHTDRRTGFVHNACWERQPDDDVVPSPGVGNATTWPIFANVMTYHTPPDLPKTLTRGQRDQVICRLSYTNAYGQLQRIPRADGEPCTLRPGGDATKYGPVGVTRKVAHGACASGICQVTAGGGGTTAVCAPSSCSDGLIGAAETSRDCGGACPNACPTDRGDASPPSRSACVDDADCVSGICREDYCQPTCGDGNTNAAELAQDGGGSGYSLGCDGQGQNALCRFDDDCTGALACDGTGDCVLSADCPINSVLAPCTNDGDCPTGACAVLARRCSTTPCFTDSQCPETFCDLSVNRCGCEMASDCPGSGEACNVSRSFCTGQCSDGRCLGTCELQVGF